MLIAWDKDDQRVHIDETKSNQSYYCPYCGTELITRKGNIRVHHFAHKKTHICNDSWEREGLYEMSEWHSNWQNLFPIANQEVSITLGTTKHRADVLIDKTVIEFQHSSLKPKVFDDRINFYLNLNYKVVWLFDMQDSIESGDMSFGKSSNNKNIMHWKHPNKAFNTYDVKEGKIDLFFQLYDSNENKNCIVRVLDVSENGFSQFEVSNIMTKVQFLDYVGLKGGKCLQPDKMDVLTNSDYIAFKEKYNIKLNKQQERALISVEGNNLLLAVPGSGKTTVLVDRLGYMIFVKHIDPKDILCLTYGKNAAKEMKSRFQQQFSISKNEITFSTINALSNYIYHDWCKLFPTDKRTMIDAKQENDIKRKLLKENNEFVSSDDVTKFSSAITYAKNMMMKENELKEIEDTFPSFIELYKEYYNTLKSCKLMDFDDQLIYAYKILKNGSLFPNGNNNLLFSKKLKSKYKYICVDEAQDTSKIQHAIIKLLSSNGSLFMVGDEDQSIYGFRAAYPKALLNFKTDYKNPYILKMEKNYRSTPEIVNIAQKFITKNTGRYEKKMISEKSVSNIPVQLIKVSNTEKQYEKCLEIVKNRKDQISFLFRNNITAIPIVDLFLRNNILFSLKKPQYDFFNGVNVKATIAILKLSLNYEINNEDIQALNRAKCIHMQSKTINYLLDNSKVIGFYNALDEQMKYVNSSYKADSHKLQKLVANVKNSTAYTAINLILQEYYDKETYEITVLKIIAKYEPTIQSFLKRIRFIEKTMKTDISNPRSNIVLSTIHNAKGQEYDSVYLLDVYDDRFPTSAHNYFNGSKDSSDVEQEERRLFYVALTRAKKNLGIFRINSLHSSYIEELFHAEKKKETSHLQKRSYSTKKYNYHKQAIHYSKPITISSIAVRQEIIDKNAKKMEENNEQELYKKCLYEVKNKLTQQKQAVFDHTGRRWFKCKICGKIAPREEFASYGGENQLNLGKCYKCSMKK